MPTTFPFARNEAAPDGATESCRMLDDRIRELRQDLNAYLGLLNNQTYTGPIGSTALDGTFTFAKPPGFSTGFILPNVTPTVVGQLGRTNTLENFHDGVAPRVNQVITAPLQGQIGAVSDINTEFPFINLGIAANTLGTGNRWRGFFLTRVGLLSGASVQMRFALGGVTPMALSLGNASGSTAGLTLCPLSVEIWANSTTGAQILSAEWRVSQTQNIVPDAFASQSPIVSQAVACTGNSALDLLLQMNVLFSAASPANQIDCLGGLVMVQG